MADDESLLDVFVNIRPDPAWESHIEQMTRDAVKKITDIFASANVKLPNVQAAATGPSAASAIGAQAQAAAQSAGTLQDKITFARRAVQDLTIDLNRVKIGLDVVNADRLNANLELSKNTAKDLGLALNRAVEDGADTAAIDLFIHRIELAADGAALLRDNLSAASRITAQFEQIKRDEKRDRQEFAVERKLANASSIGLQSGQLRQQIAQVTAEIQRSQNYFDELVRDFDGSPEHLERLELAARSLRGEIEGSIGRNAFKQLDQDVRNATPSMNALQNNAYQLGQAFEDAAIGFSLNGIAGAVRGASNNITFLIQNMAVAQAQIAKTAGLPVSKLTQQLPLYASIAAALGLVFIEPVAKWIDSLDDVDAKFSDIADTFASTVKDTEIATGFSKTARELQETLKEATSVKDILKEIEEINGRTVDSVDVIKQSFGDLADAGKIKDSIKDVSSLNREVEALVATQKNRISIIENQGKTPAFNAATDTPSLGIQASPEDIAAAKNRLNTLLSFQKEFRQATVNLRDAQISSAAGLDGTSEKVIKANESYRNLLVILKQLGPEATGDFKGSIDKDKIKQATDSVSLLAGELEKLAVQAKKLNDDSFSKLPSAWQAVIDKADQFEFSIRATRANLNGLISDEAVKLNDFLQGVLQEKENLNEIIKAQLGSDSLSLEELNKAKNTILRINFGNQNNVLLGQIKELQDKIEEVGKSKFTTFEQLSKDLQTNVLGGDDKAVKTMGELTKELQRLRDVQSELIRQFEQDQQPLTQKDVDTAGKRLDDIESKRRVEAQQLILPIKEQFIDFMNIQRDRLGASANRPTGRPLGEDSFSGLSQFLPDRIPTSKGEVAAVVVEKFAGIATLIKDGIRESMRESSEKIVGSQDKTTEEVKKIKVGATAQ